jgi:hypothetical protein
MIPLLIWILPILKHIFVKLKIEKLQNLLLKSFETPEFWLSVKFLNLSLLCHKSE